MLFRVIFCVNGQMFYTPKQTLDNLCEDAIIAQTAHLISLIDIGEVFEFIYHNGGSQYLIIRVE